MTDRKFIQTFFLGALIALLSIAAQAAAPANDNLANAQVLNGVAGSTVATIADATREQGEDLHTLSSTTTVYRTVWFEWTATDTKPVVLKVASSGFDASLAVYTGAAFPLTAISLNNDTIGNRPRIEFAAVTGTTYKIAVGVYNDNNASGGDFTLQWTVQNNPTNDNFANALNLETTLAGSVAFTNQSATKEANEPVHIAGNRSVWLTLTNNQPYDYSLTLTTGRLATFIDTTISVYTGTTLQNLTPVVKNDNLPAQSVSRVTFLAKSGTTYRIAIDEGSNPDQWSAVLNWSVTNLKTYTDFATVMNDGQIHYDDAADLSVFRPANGSWWIRNSHTGVVRAVQFGSNGDTPVASDYDGDGRTDLAVARDTAEGKIWYINNSFDGTYSILQWGLAGDKPVVGDYDTDGRADLAVFRPSNGTWYIRKSSDGDLIAKLFGFSTDIPVAGDFKGTPKGTDIAVFRPSNGTWYVLDGNGDTIFVPFGIAGDKPVVADYDADGKSDFALYRPTNGTWYILRSGGNQLQFVKWGLPDDIPMTGDYDNNTNDLDDFAVFRPSENRWYILRGEGSVSEVQQFGANGDLPVSSPVLLAQ